MIAARKLKFKPKPLVSGAIRRARDKDETPAHPQKDPDVAEKNLEHTEHTNSNVDENRVTKKLKIKQTLPEADEFSEKLASIESKVLDITQECNKTVEIDGIFDKDTIKPSIVNITNQQIIKIVTSEPIPSESSSTNSTVGNSVITKNLNCEKNAPDDENSIINLNNSSTTHSDNNKPDNAKVVPRFARSKCKPILNNPGMRKKINTVSTEGDSEKDSTSVLTDSVIKSGQVELNKANATVLEITDSFSSIETEEDSFPVRTTSENQENRIQINVPVSESVSTSLRETEQNHSSCLNNSQEANENSSDTLHTQANPTITSKISLTSIKTISKVLVSKPSPRLSDVCGKKISFQGSDSEEQEEPRQKNLKSKETPNLIIREKKEKELKKAKRKRSQGSTYSKLGHDTLMKFEKKFGIEPPDKNKLTMLDLIFYNPKSNPMTVNPAVPSKKREGNVDINETVEEILDEQNVDDVESTTSSLPVPQLTVGPDGQVMLDPKSLVIETTGTEKSRQELEKSQVIHDTGIVRYNTYSKKKHQRSDWTPQETLQFYRVLNTIGTDFALMTKLFPKRSRHELKLKFKREEKVNLHLIDKAMTGPADFDFKLLEEELRLENEEIERKALDKKLFKEKLKQERLIKKENKVKTKRAGRYYSEFNEDENKQLRAVREPQKRTRERRKTSKAKKSVIEEIDSDLDEELQIDIDLVSRTSSPFRNSDDDEGLNLIKMVKETCSGRVPKRTKKLEEYEELNETLKKKLHKDSDSEDSYTPNGPDADELFGSPKQISQDTEEKHWNINISALPIIEETVLGNTEEVSEISELGSFGQNSDAALDLSIIRGGTQEDSPEKTQNNALLNRHLISESIQIIDQLASNVDNPVVVGMDKSEREDVPVQVQDKIPLPSFESVSRSWPTMVYTHVEAPYVPLAPGSETMINGNSTLSEPNVVFNFYNSRPTVDDDDDGECIIGD